MAASTLRRDPLEEWKRELAKRWVHGTSATARIVLDGWLRYDEWLWYKETRTDSPKSLPEDRQSADTVGRHCHRSGAQ